MDQCGLMAVIPQPPVFTDGTAPTLAQLQALAQSVSFLVDTDNRPIWHFYRTSANQGISADTWTQINTGSVAFDSDGVHDTYQALVGTPGYSAVESCLSIGLQSSATLFATCIGIIAGANNPNLTSGDYYLFGYRAGLTGTSGVAGSADAAYTSCDITPWPLYPGDQVAPYAWANTTATIDYNNLQNYQLGRWVCNFTGYWIRSESLTEPTPSSYNLNLSTSNPTYSVGVY